MIGLNLCGKDIVKIVITGGPCAGKTTAMNSLKERIKGMGYSLVFVPETATELICSGLAPWTLSGSVSYQKFQMMLQLEKERIYTQAAADIKDTDKVLMVFDRGAVDNKAYITDDEYAGILRELSLSEDELVNGYDGIFHLVTAAKGAVEQYTLSNNNARTESPEEAAKLDDRLMEVWKKHPYVRVVDNSCGFEEKIKKLTDEIILFLTEHEKKADRQ